MNDVTDKVKFAMSFAALCHQQCGHTYDDQPYRNHLKMVVDVLFDFGECDKNMLAAAWLHDVVEDCGISLATIRDLFGDRVAELVGAVTDEPGDNRKIRKDKTYTKIRGTPGAIQLKLADRIANVSNSIETGNRRTFLMYQKEQTDFSDGLGLYGDISALEQAMANYLRQLFVVGASGSMAPKINRELFATRNKDFVR